MYVERAGLRVEAGLAAFLEDEVLPRVDLPAAAFWDGAAEIFTRFTPRNRYLLATRDRLQAALDAWFSERCGGPIDPDTQEAFLRDIGYLVSDPPEFAIETADVDDEIAVTSGPQLVVPVLNARFLLNAANARWGSLYDALYGTDAISGQPRPGGYDPDRGSLVIAWAKGFLDEIAPLAAGAHADAPGYRIEAGHLVPRLRDPGMLAGYRGPAEAPSAILLRHHGLHIEICVDRNHSVGRTDPAGVADVLLESALTTIVDLEDSVAAVDGPDKTAAYANWLHLLLGDLEADFEKAGSLVRRTLAEDRRYSTSEGGMLSLSGRSLLMIRNVGHLMTTPALLGPDGSEAPEGILDAIVTSLIGLVDLLGLGRFQNSQRGSLYIVKPKMHGPEEVAFANDLFDAVEDLLELARHTIKIGVMDEERRTSANLAACIAAVKGRIFFVNTGFLDRTGDEIHTAMRAGPMIPKTEMKAAGWIRAYEQRNVQIALASGFPGRAQIGKGMWATPDRMADMLAQKIDHPRAGANTAWVPSPTAATLHATHYHRVDVPARQAELSAEQPAPLRELLNPPIALGRNWSAKEVRDEIENNAQGILGYVVRWVDQGVGCSKVPDIHDVGLMEDRATLRISSQHIANWLLHQVCRREEVEAAMARMARKVDNQNAGDPAYCPMADSHGESVAFQAAQALVFQGVDQPNGYTEPLLHALRRRKKAADA